jgi:tRNA(Glu) U13 pseudouridine synthase TruD
MHCSKERKRILKQSQKKKTLNLLDEQIRIENKHLKELNEINSNSAFFTSISVLPPDQNLSLSVARFGLRGNADFESMKYVVT